MSPSEIIKSLPELIYRNTGAIFLLSAVASLLIALVVFSLLRRFQILRDVQDKQDNRWIKPFARAFLVLAVMYSIRFIYWMLKGPFRIEVPPSFGFAVQVTTAICSGLSNYFFFEVGFSLARRGRRYGAKVLEFLHLNQVTARIIVFAILLVVAYIGMTESRWARIPDTLVSMSALAFVGVALYRNISFRRDPTMAWLALVASIVYAVLHVLYGIHPWLAEAGWANWIPLGGGSLKEKIEKMDLIIFTLALPLKFGLFFPGYALMLMIANPTGEVRHLLKNVTHESVEFLDNNGVVRSIQAEIHASRVELYIKLAENRVARYSYPPEEPGHGPDEIRPKGPTDYGEVISTGNELLYRLINYSDQIPEFLEGKLSAQSSLLAVPVYYHDVVIGCLKAELDEGKFTEADMQNIRRFAALISPSVQDFREVNAFSEISQSLTRVQIEASGYAIKADIEEIAQKTHDVLTPFATGVSIEAGFCRYWATIPKGEPYKSMVDRQLNFLDSGFYYKSDNERLDWVAKILRTYPDKLGKQNGEPVAHNFGKLVLANDKQAPPTFATNSFHHKVVANLIGEGLLNFIRGFLGEINRNLGVCLNSVSEASVSSWFATVEKKAREAALLWAVATQPGNDELLGERASLVEKLESEGRWAKKDLTDRDTSYRELYVCKVMPPRDGTYYVIRVPLDETGDTLWLGVGNPAFGVELDYLSPWAAFILRFGELAGTGLKRILERQKQEELVKGAAELHGLATAAITTGTVVHQMVNQVRDLIGPLTTLEQAIKYDTLPGNDIHKRLILSLGKSARQIEWLAKRFSGVTKRDERRPCPLYEAVQYASELQRDSFTRYNIHFDDTGVPREYVIDVPFYVAAFALANLLTNAKDAIRDARVKDGSIQVTAEETSDGKMILCHVKDDGPGVPPDMIGRLFESSGKSSKSHGSGLGLYLSARSLRENRGDIKLTERGPNPRTTFTIYFPKQRED